MFKRKKWPLIQLLGERYVLNILDALLEGSKRFTDLVDACQNEKTRTAKLRRLEETGLIETVSSKIGKRFFVHYKLTEEREGDASRINEDGGALFSR